MWIQTEVKSQRCPVPVLGGLFPHPISILGVSSFFSLVPHQGTASLVERPLILEDPFSLQA